MWMPSGYDWSSSAAAAAASVDFPTPPGASEGDETRLLEEGENRDQFGVAPDESRRSRHADADGPAVGHLSDEPIPATPNVADRVLLTSVVTDGASDLLDSRGQVRLGEKGVAPHAVEQFHLVDDPISMLDEVAQEVERLRLQVHRFAGPTEIATGHIKIEVAESEHGPSLSSGAANHAGSRVRSRRKRTWRYGHGSARARR